MKESTFQANIIKAAKKLKNCKIVKYGASAYGEKGTPDLIGCYRGMYFTIEVKTEKGKVSKIQAHRLKEWAATGAAVSVARPGFDLEEWLEDSYNGRLQKAWTEWQGRNQQGNGPQALPSKPREIT